MTQKQRMEQGLIYDPTADEIMNEQTGVAQYLKEYNSLGLGDEKRVEELLRLMLAECGENCYLQPRFMQIGAELIFIWAIMFMLILT